MTEPKGTPFVSVVIPTRNRARYLPQAVGSALDQTFRDLEVLVVDDGSVDGTHGALAPFLGGCRYVRQEQRGVAAARNRGVGDARGKWIAFLDSDDWWESDAIERVLSAAEGDPEVGLVAMWAHGVDEDGERNGRTFRKRSAGPYFSTVSLLTGDAGAVLTPVVRKDLLLSVSGFDESLVAASDCDMWLRLSFLTRMLCVDDALLNVRVHAGNASRDKAQNARMWLRILEKLAAERPEFVRLHPFAYRRALGKERLRLGRELLARSARTKALLTDARRSLGSSIAAYPLFARAFLYLAWSYVAPSTYASWREREERRRS